jgi:hypothetical protein
MYSSSRCSSGDSVRRADSVAICLFSFCLGLIVSGVMFMTTQSDLYYTKEQANKIATNAYILGNAGCMEANNE